MELPKPVDPDAIIAERRKRRAEILAKYSSAAVATPSETSRVGTPDITNDAPRVGTPGRSDVERETKRLKLGTGE